MHFCFNMFVFLFNLDFFCDYSVCSKVKRAFTQEKHEWQIYLKAS